MSINQELSRIQDQLAAFAKERDWEQFHSPKNLAMALSVEASELQEHFIWLSEKASSNLDTSQKAKVEEEIADVFLYTLLLAAKLDIDIEQSLVKKMRKNAVNYPAEKVKGSAKKYTEYD